jgi:hypothetical protein
LDELFDENLIFGGTERELLQRMVLKGHLFKFIPDLFVIHQSDISWLELIKKGSFRPALEQLKKAEEIARRLGLLLW